MMALVVNSGIHFTGWGPRNVVTVHPEVILVSLKGTTNKKIIFFILSVHQSETTCWQTFH